MPKEKIILSTWENSHVEAWVGWANDSGSVNLDVVAYEDDGGVPRLLQSVIADSLSYQSINALIKYLRRARDAAYGKPE